MGKRKLILICQTGGKFKKNNDGTLSYAGGEAEALDINHETTFGDLKLKIAKLWHLDCESLSLKYFIPGNRKIPITLKHEKDLKRMYDFHYNSVTADIFVTGQVAFFPEPVATTSRREGKEEQLTTDLPSEVLCGVSVQTGAELSVERSPQAEISGADSLFDVPVSISDYPIGVQCRTPEVINASVSPANCVKRQRLAADWESDPNGFPIANHCRNTDAMRKRQAPNGSISLISETDTEEHGDPLPVAAESNPCHSTADSLFASWKNLITGIGQEFNSIGEFRDALQKFAIAHHFSYKLKKNEANRASGTCAVEGCSWRINASRVPSSMIFKIKNMNKIHTCQGQPWKVAHPPKNWLVSIIKEKLLINPSLKTRDIANGFLQDFGLQLSYCQVWRAIEEARVQMQGSHKDAYSHLTLLSRKMTKANPGSLIKLVIGEDRRFQCFFVSFRTCIGGFENGCRPLLFLDAMPLKSKYHETLLIASALDGEDCVFPVAFAVVDIETENSWHWFLSQLGSAISNSRPITFVSDKEKGLAKSIMYLFNSSHHGYSIFYLMEDFLRNMRGPFGGDGKVSLPVNFLSAARANRVEGFKSFMEHIKRVSSRTYEWLMKIEPERWANAFFKGERYNHINFDVADIYNRWVQDTSELPIAKKIESIIYKVAELVIGRQEKWRKWPGKLTPSKEKALQEECGKARCLKMFISSDTTFEVHDHLVHVVDVEKQECSCSGWDSMFPCQHAITVLNSQGKSIHEYCSKFFTVEAYRITYSECVNPPSVCEGNDRDDAAEPIRPPPFRVPSHESKILVKRRGLKRSVCCTRCHGLGHNKATCKEPL